MASEETLLCIVLKSCLVICQHAQMNNGRKINVDQDEFLVNLVLDPQFTYSVIFCPHFSTGEYWRTYFCWTLHISSIAFSGQVL